MAKYYWVDDTQVLSLGGCPGHSEQDILKGELIPDWYPEEYEEKFDKFCQNQQISTNRKVTFSEKQQAKLVNAQSAVGKLRARITEQTGIIKNLEKKVEDFEVNISQIEVLEGHKEELKQLKAEKKALGESLAALKNEKVEPDKQIKAAKEGLLSLTVENKKLNESVESLSEEKDKLDEKFIDYDLVFDELLSALGQDSIKKDDKFALIKQLEGLKEKYGAAE